MLERYEESMIDLETLLKIDPSNTAAKKELQTVMKLKEEEVKILVRFKFGSLPFSLEHMLWVVSFHTTSSQKQRNCVVTWRSFIG
jgi:hypothetical protein